MLVIYGAGVALLIGVFALLISSMGTDTNVPSSSTGLLRAPENNFDFGTVSMKDGDVSHSFEVKNEGAEPVRISKVYTSCMCTSAVIVGADGKKYGRFGMPGHDLPTRTNIEVGAGESITVEAIFDPTAHGPSAVGLAQRSIYLETNSTQAPKVEVKFTALVTQ